MFTNMSVEIDIVNYLSDVNSGEEGIMFASSFIMGGGDALKRWMFDTGGERHVQIAFEVDRWDTRSGRKE